jgi:hypothetical protein
VVQYVAFANKARYGQTAQYNTVRSPSQIYQSLSLGAVSSLCFFWCRVYRYDNCLSKFAFLTSPTIRHDLLSTLLFFMRTKIFDHCQSISQVKCVPRLPVDICSKTHHQIRDCIIEPATGVEWEGRKKSGSAEKRNTVTIFKRKKNWQVMFSPYYYTKSHQS